MWFALFLVVILGAVGGVLLPFLKPGETWESPTKESDLDKLLAEKQRTLRTLKDLEQERMSGLMSQSDHDAARTEYLERAVDLNRRIASLTGVDPTRMQDGVST